MRAMALDLGSVWIGVAMSDQLRMFCKPYATIKLDELETFLATTLVKEKVSTVVVGYPKTMRGTQSQQTLEVIKHKEKLELLFPDVAWLFWDERLSSKQAAHMNSGNKHDKHKEHAIAAAIILQAYLESANLQSY